MDSPRGLLVVCTIVLMSAGCTVGPKYTRPIVQVEESWLDASDERIRVEPDAADYSQWWKTLDDSVLDGLIQTAYDQNLPLQIAGLRVLEARAQRGIAVGGFFPQLQEATIGATGTHISDNAANAAMLDKKSWDYDVGLQAVWELDFWGKFRRAIASGDAALLASVADYDSVLVSLIADVAATYVEIRTFEERLGLARGNIELQRESLKIADVRFRNGAVSELDVQQAKSNLASTQALVPILENGLRLAKNRLCVLLGIPPRDIRDLLGEPGTIPTAASDVVLGVPADLLRRRPDVRRAERIAAAASERIGIAYADFYPSFTLSGFTGVQTSTGWFSGTGSHPGIKNIFDAASFTGFIDLGFNWPVLNYSRIANNVRVQDARFQQTAIAYRDVVLRAAAEVENGLVGFLRSQEQARFLFESVEAARRSVELAHAQYRDGAIDYTRVLQTETALSIQEDGWAVARGTIAGNLISLYRAFGGGWELRKGREFVAPRIAEEMRSRVNWGHVLSIEQETAGEKLFELSNANAREASGDADGS